MLTVFRKSPLERETNRWPFKEAAMIYQLRLFACAKKVSISMHCNLINPLDVCTAVLLCMHFYPFCSDLIEFKCMSAVIVRCACAFLSKTAITIAFMQ